ncbi:AI-2E family transporter [Aestuariivirga sp.]|uniref:AI-2E family transporter n=1 Tax=Aestuariivirga sp. TaxID=2650926 RepID=UPI00391A59DB
MEQPGGERQDRAGPAALTEKFALLLLFSLLLAGVYLVLKPFAIGLVFGCILAIAAWPVRAWLVRAGLSGTLAAVIMLAALLLFVLLPVVLSAPGLALEVKALVERGSAWLATSPQLPAWITGLPFVGGKLATQWEAILHQTPEAQAMLVSYAEPLRKFLTDAAVGLASSVVHLAVALIVATSFWAGGGAIVQVLRDSLAQLGGSKLADLTDVAGNAVRGVFYGIVGTAAIQGVLMGLGLLIVGVPGAAPLGFVTLILAISQFGGVLINIVWGGAAWWLYTTSGTGLAFWFVVVWGIFVTFVDNLLKPLLIGARMKLPIMLVILGVFGGFISFGFLGLFIGPTLLAVAYDLLAAWRGQRLAAEESPPAA